MKPRQWDMFFCSLASAKWKDERQSHAKIATSDSIFFDEAPDDFCDNKRMIFDFASLLSKLCVRNLIMAQNLSLSSPFHCFSRFLKTMYLRMRNKYSCKSSIFALPSYSSRCQGANLVRSSFDNSTRRRLRQEKPRKLA